MDYVYGLVQNCSNPFINALELLQSCSTKPSIFCDMKKKKKIVYNKNHSCIYTNSTTHYNWYPCLLRLGL